MSAAADLPSLLTRLDKAAAAATQNATRDRQAGWTAQAALFDQYAALFEQAADKIRSLQKGTP